MSIEVNPGVFEKVMRPDRFGRQVSENLKVSECDDQNTVTIRFETDGPGVGVLKGMFEGVGQDEEMEKLLKNPINNPAHYTDTKFEAWDVLDEFFPDDPLKWNAGKYILRAGRKGDEVEDLRKAIQYLLRRIDKLEGES